MLVQIEAFQLTFLRDAKHANRVQAIHHDQRNTECRETGNGASNELSGKQLRATAVEETLERSRIVGTEVARGAVFAGSEQAERKRSPDAAHAVHRNRADRIVDAEVFEKFNAEINNHAGNGGPT